MIVDKVRIFIQAGNGGNGAVSFHREKYITAGGPDGGDGGNGGNIIFQASEDLRTLMDFRYNQKFVAQHGGNGGKKNMHGKNGEDLIIKVPPGTVVIDESSEMVAADLKQGAVRTVLKGGKGGKGNARFSTSTRQAPRFSTPGRKAKGRFVILELKSIADVGLIGFPNVGKSTFLSVVTSARPKIANYPFTTLNPNLGVVKNEDYSFVIADIPGLIEGASEGVGLGHDFLRHIERTRMLVHIIDVSGMDGRDPVDDYHKIRQELEGYSAELAQKPELIVANKMDVAGAQDAYEKLCDALPDKTIFGLSALTHSGTQELIYKIMQVLKTLPQPESYEEEGIIEQWNDEIEDFTFEIVRGMDGIVEANGNLIDEVFARIDPDDPSSMRHFHKLLVDFGVIKQLRNFGVKDGDEVRLNGELFDFVE